MSSITPNAPNAARMQDAPPVITRTGKETSHLQCIRCDATYDMHTAIYTCKTCGGLLDVQHDLDALRGIITRELWDARLGSVDEPYNSGVWRYKELIFNDLPLEQVISRGEGNTNLYRAPKRLAAYTGANRLALKHEGENPTGSFKDRGMTGGITHAMLVGATSVLCASTGNTSASMASYAALAGVRGLVFFPYGNVALGKLSQSVAYGALNVQVRGDFDASLKLVREACDQFDIYLLNSVNPFRLEGQKTILFEILQQRKWKMPDWIVLPGGNLGNSSALGKGLHELLTLGLIDKMPRVAIIQAAGASPFYTSYQNGFESFTATKAHTVATAIKIGNPASYDKAIRTIRWTNGIVESVTDQEIVDAKAMVDQSGIGCEPASAASVAGVKKLIAAGVIHPDEDVVGILTGHVLKDPDLVINYHNDTLDDLRGTYANKLRVIDPSLADVEQLLAMR